MILDWTLPLQPSQAVFVFVGSGFTPGVSVGVYIPGNWPQIRARRQVRTAAATVQGRTIAVSPQPRTIVDPRMGE